MARRLAPKKGRQARSMNDRYSLVVPTFNRSPMLASLLRYLDRQRADFPILVFDSSHDVHRERNRRLVKQLALRVTYVECDESMQPFDKFREAVHRVGTPFCGLCADDDVVILDGLRRCVEHLERHEDVCVAHGYYFTFVDHGVGWMDLLDILSYAPSIDSKDPLTRLRCLFGNYQALTYGTYRTAALRYVFDTVRAVESMLAQELLSGALSVVRGKAVRLGCFTNGRSLGASEPYRHWHPLEWLIDSPDGLFADYVRYRSVLVRELMASPAWGRLPAVTQRVVDLIHIFYLVRHAPAEAHDFILDHVISEKDTYEFWSAHEIQLPLIHDNRYLSSAPSHHWRQVVRRMGRLIHASRYLLSALGRPRRAEVAGPPSPGASERETWPREVATGVRRYRLHKEFMQPQPRDLVNVTEDEVVRLLGRMDDYRMERE